VNAVVSRAEMQKSCNIPLTVGADAKCQSENAKRQINHAEDKAKSLAPDKVPAKPK
jgi:hypothetical protein